MSDCRLTRARQLGLSPLAVVVFLHERRKKRTVITWWTSVAPATLGMVNTEKPCDEAPHSRQLAGPGHEEKMALETRFKWLDS